MVKISKVFRPVLSCFEFVSVLELLQSTCAENTGQNQNKQNREVLNVMKS